MTQIREIKVKDLVTHFVVPAILIPTVWIACVFIPIFENPSAVKAVKYAVCGVVSYILLRRLAIGAILVYKAFAPKKIRDNCRFFPTCSTYMLMCVQRYGLILGITKGIKRIIRCKPPNSGIDYPYRREKNGRK